MPLSQFCRTSHERGAPNVPGARCKPVSTHGRVRWRSTSWFPTSRLGLSRRGPSLRLSASTLQRSCRTSRFRRQGRPWMQGRKSCTDGPSFRQETFEIHSSVRKDDHKNARRRRWTCGLRSRTCPTARTDGKDADGSDGHAWKDHVHVSRNEGREGGSRGLRPRLSSMHVHPTHHGTNDVVFFHRARRKPLVRRTRARVSIHTSVGSTRDTPTSASTSSVSVRIEPDTVTGDIRFCGRNPPLWGVSGSSEGIPVDGMEANRDRSRNRATHGVSDGDERVQAQP